MTASQSARQLESLDRSSYVLERFRQMISTAIAEDKSGWLRVNIKLQRGEIRAIQLQTDEDLSEVRSEKTE